MRSPGPVFDQGASSFTDLPDYRRSTLSRQALLVVLVSPGLNVDIISNWDGYADDIYLDIYSPMCWLHFVQLAVNLGTWLPQ
jgi:hypothetical protein